MREVLYVEDEESDALLLQIAFKELGIQQPFQLVTDGEAAIQYLAGHGDYADRNRFPLPCLILLDLNLPRKNGFEVLLWRREHSLVRKIPVVIFSSSTNPRDIDRAYDLGASAYLTKLTDLDAAIKRACAIRDFWLEQNTPPPPL